MSLTFAMGKTIVVDSTYGNDSTGAREKLPFATINAAVAAAQDGDHIEVLPGTYNLTSGITLPTGVTLFGADTQRVIIQMLNVTSNTTLVTMGEGSRVEQATLKLTSSQHVQLVGIDFPGTTSAKVRTAVIIVDNSTAVEAGGPSEVIGIRSNGTGQPGHETNSIRATTIQVKSTGTGRKRGVYVDGANKFSLDDCNIVCDRTGSTGTDYIGAETNHVSAELLISLRITRGTNAAISQTLGILTCAAIELIADGELANSKGFNQTFAPSLIVISAVGTLPTGATRFLPLGNASPTSSEIKYLVSQKMVITSMRTRLSIAPGIGKFTTFTLRKNGINTPMTLSLTGLETYKDLTTMSVTFNANDEWSVSIITDSGNQSSDPFVLFETY